MGGSSPAARVKVTQTELASMLGVSRESVNKELQRLAHEGLVRPRRGAIEIPDFAALQAFALHGPTDDDASDARLWDRPAR